MNAQDRGGGADERPVPTATVRIGDLSPLVAAAIGVLAVWAALGVGHLVAGLLSAASSPLLAVGDMVIRLSPEPLTEFAKKDRIVVFRNDGRRWLRIAFDYNQAIYDNAEQNFQLRPGDIVIVP